MKKYLFTMFASLICCQALPALSSNYYESLNEIEAVTTSPLFTDLVYPGEGVVSIVRKMRRFRATQAEGNQQVIYIIKTSMPGEQVQASSDVEKSENMKPEVVINTYRVVVEITPNEKLGNPVKTVISAQKISTQNRTFLGRDHRWKHKKVENESQLKAIEDVEGD